VGGQFARDTIDIDFLHSPHIWRFQITVGLPFSDKELAYAVAEAFSSDEQPTLLRQVSSTPGAARFVGFGWHVRVSSRCGKIAFA
jgi:hypothetical protein